MIEIENLKLGYGNRILITDASASVSGGQIVALLGRNGAGKSTLLRALCGMGEYLDGTVSLCGKDLKSMSRRELSRTVSLVSTERVRIPNLYCKDVVALGRAPYTNWVGKMSDADYEVVNRSLELVGMSSYAHKTMDCMSDGECQRIMIARALAQDTKIILLDEPTSFLDLPNRYELVTLLRDMAHKENKCILFSTHELDIALSLCESIMLIDGPNLFYSSTDAMKRSGHIEKAFRTSGFDFESYMKVF